MILFFNQLYFILVIMNRLGNTEKVDVELMMGRVVNNQVNKGLNDVLSQEFPGTPEM